MSKRKQEADYQLDLTPFISLLSVCICFLLLTVAWFQVGALSVKQVMGAGTAKAEKKEDKLALWIYMKPKNQIEVRFKKGNRVVSQQLISSLDSAFDFKKFKNYVIGLKNRQADLNEAFIIPKEDALYEDIIKLMDGIRQAGIFSMGLSPI